MAKTSRPITEEQPSPGEHGDPQTRKKPNPSSPITEEQPQTDTKKQDSGDT